MQKIKEKMESFSKTFKICFSALFIIYLLFWCFTIHLAGVQKTEGITPLLPVLAQDSHEYADLAQSIITHNSFVFNGQEDYLRVPGYPFFVAVLYSVGGYFLVTLVQILLIFLAALFIREIGMYFFERRVGELAAIVFLCNPVVLVLSLVILTDALFLFFFVFGFYLAVAITEKKFLTHTALASIMFACAMYIRPMGVFALPIFVLPFLLANISTKQKIKAIVWMILIVVVALSPWIYRNYTETGVADVSSFKAFNLACCSTSLYLANKLGTTPAVELAYIATGSGVPQGQWSNLKFSPPLSAFTENIILEHPFSYGIFHVTASLPFLFSSSIDEAIYQYRAAMNLPIVASTGAIHYLLSGQVGLFVRALMTDIPKLAERVLLILIYLIALFGFWKERKKLVVWVLLFIPLYLMILSGPAANVRYAVQATPFILILFSVGFFALFSKKFRKTDW